MPLDLAEHYRKILEELLAIHIPNADVWVHGSRVNGTAHEGSDLDLVLRNSSDITVPCPNRQAFMEAFEASTIPILVDIVDWTELPDWLREKIITSHEIFREAPPR
jgi:predicted nucleotidyltransferase